MPDEYGDFQTPPALVDQLLDTLPDRPWARVLEPTCGVGRVLAAAARRFPGADLVGVELQASYVDRARAHARVVHASVFDVDLRQDLGWGGSPGGPTLVVGNPPWVTTAALAVLGSDNRPARVTTPGVRGIDAVTGSSNFDVAEAVWLRLLTAFAGTDTTIALLCKTQVARSVLLRCAERSLPVRRAHLRLVDAGRWFGAGVDACWFVVELEPAHPPAAPSVPAPTYTADVHPALDAEPTHRIGVVGGVLVADLAAHARTGVVDGRSPVVWRQGVKHDAAAVMELLVTPAGLTTRAGEPVDVEDHHVFPLLKCTDVHRDRVLVADKAVLVPQRHPGDDTAALATTAPRLHAHLLAHAGVLDARRSTIYRNRPRFAVFGLGPYTFAPYKVAVSGFHKQPAFRVLGPLGGKPVVVDDATYLVPCDRAVDAAVVHALLTAPEAAALVDALLFRDSKRPVTKRLLQRLDLVAVAAVTDRARLVDHAHVQLARLGPGCATESPEPADPAIVLDALVETWAAQSV